MDGTVNLSPLGRRSLLIDNGIEGNHARAAAPLRSDHTSNARALAARYSLAVTYSRRS